ncbi:MAG: hypothetical protein AB1668_04140 [Nanoarchaeota archaeon]
MVNQKQKILIAIPAYGGNIMVQCFNSVLKLYKNIPLNEGCGTVKLYYSVFE